MNAVPSDWRERLNRAYADGRDSGGLPCCGTKGVDHLPGCSTGRGVSVEAWFGLRPKLCVVPDCTERARLVFTAAEPGRLAGRAWELGDEIDLCPAHGNDVYAAQGVWNVDELAGWLRPDARSTPPDFATGRGPTLSMRSPVRP